MICKHVTVWFCQSEYLCLFSFQDDFQDSPPPAKKAKTSKPNKKHEAAKTKVAPTINTARETSGRWVLYRGSSHPTYILIMFTLHLIQGIPSVISKLKNFSPRIRYVNVIQSTIVENVPRIIFLCNEIAACQLFQQQRLTGIFFILPESELSCWSCMTLRYICLCKLTEMSIWALSFWLSCLINLL